MIPIEVEVFSLANPTTMLEVLNARISPSFMEELRGPGAGAVTLSMSDPKITADPTLIQARNILRFKVDSKVVGAMVIGDKTSKIIDDSSERETFEVSGESLRTWFNDAVVYPEGGLKQKSYEERSFNFASIVKGTWYKSAQWVNPTWVMPWGDVVISPWRYAPAQWPDVPQAGWIWSSNSAVSAPLGDNYFRFEFTTATDGDYSVFSAADNDFEVFIDGQLITTSKEEGNSWSWATTIRTDTKLAAGSHVVAFKVTNLGAGTPAGLIASVFRAGDATMMTPAVLIGYTGQAGSAWKVNAYPAEPPGWNPGEIMLTLLNEAQARGVRFPTWLTPTFTAVNDSYGNPWTVSMDWTFGIGTSLAEVLNKLEELVCDLWIDPETFQLHMVAERGLDRSDYGYGASPYKTRTNLVTNSGFEVSTAGWTAEGGAVLTRDTSSPISGSASGKLTGGGDIYIIPNTSGVIGSTVTFSISYRTSGTVTGTPQITVGGGGVTKSVALPNTQTTAARFSVTSNVVSSSSCICAIYLPTSPGIVWVDDIQLSTDTEGFFDGNTPSDLAIKRAWTGTAGLSTSTEKYYSITRPILVFEKGKNLGSSSVDSSGEIKNSLIIQTSDGWLAANDTVSGSQSTYGRVESSLDTGLSETLSRAVANLVFEKKAFPEIGASYEIIPFEGHIPWQDFQVGDWVLAPDERGLSVKRRVMSISVKEDAATAQPVYAVEFDTIFQDNEEKLNRWMSKLSGGAVGGISNSGGGSSLPVGQPTITPSVPQFIKVPLAPAALAASSTGFWEVNGVSAYSKATLTWDAVTGNTDGSATVPYGYEVWGHLASEPAVTMHRISLVTTNQAVLQPYETGSVWEFKVRALHDSITAGDFSSPVTHTMLAPNNPMSAPAAPILTSDKGVLIAKWSGLLGGVAPPPQFRYVYAQVSPAGENVWTRMGAPLLREGRDIFISGLVVGSSYDVKLKAVDGIGIQSADSATATRMVTGIGLGSLEADVAAAIAAANTAALMARSTTNMLNDSSFENTPSLWSQETANVTLVATTPRTGTKALQINTTGAAYIASKYSLVLEVEAGESYYYSANVRALAAGATVDFGVTLALQYGASPGSLDTTLDLTGSPTVTTSYVTFGAVWTVPAGVRYVKPIIKMQDTGGVRKYLVDDMSFHMMVSSSLILAGAVTPDALAAGSIVAGKIATGAIASENIQAGAIVAGKIATGAVTAGTIAAGSIAANEIAAGTVSANMLQPGIGDTLNIAGNLSITTAAANLTASTAASTAALAEQRKRYDFDASGLIISDPTSSAKITLSNSRISMVQGLNTVSYWEGGVMYVPSLVGESVLLGNHQIEKYDTGTVVRRV